jgi:hypothetical protein
MDCGASWSFVEPWGDVQDVNAIDSLASRKVEGFISRLHLAWLAIANLFLYLNLLPWRLSVLEAILISSEVT